MCNIVEEYTTKRVAEIEQKTLLRSIKNLIQKKQYSPLEAIGIDKSQYNLYMALL